jgi:hypothetical protein
MKYSWKQRRWRANGAIEEGDAEGHREAWAHTMHAIRGRRLARGRCNEGFHMLSLAATQAWCCSAGSCAVLGRMGITTSKPFTSQVWFGSRPDWPPATSLPPLSLPQPQHHNIQLLQHQIPRYKAPREMPDGCPCCNPTVEAPLLASGTLAWTTHLIGAQHLFMLLEDTVRATTSVVSSSPCGLSIPYLRL